MKTTIIIISAIVLLTISSCSISQRKHYPQLNKVPVLSKEESIKTEKYQIGCDTADQISMLVVENPDTLLEIEEMQAVVQDTIEQTPIKQTTKKNTVRKNHNVGSLKLNLLPKAIRFADKVNDPGKIIWTILGWVTVFIVLSIVVSFAFDVGFIVTGVLILLVPALVIAGLIFSLRNESSRNRKKDRKTKSKVNNTSVYIGCSNNESQKQESSEDQKEDPVTREKANTKTTLFFVLLGTFALVLGLLTQVGILMIIGVVTVFAMCIAAGIYLYNSLMK